MELTASMPRLAFLERKIAGSTKFATRLRRPARPRLKIKTVHLKPGQTDAPDQPGIFTVLVVPTGLEPEAGQPIAFTPAAAGPTAATERPKRRRPATEDLLGQIKALEARKAELERRRARGLPIERVLPPAVKPKGGPAGKAAGKRRSGPTAQVRGRQHGGPK